MCAMTERPATDPDGRGVAVEMVCPGGLLAVGVIAIAVAALQIAPAPVLDAVETVFAALQ